MKKEGGGKQKKKKHKSENHRQRKKGGRNRDRQSEQGIKGEADKGKSKGEKAKTT